MIELKEFRFSCVNLDDTFTFYTTCLLMVVHKKTESLGKQCIFFRYQRRDAFLRFEYSQQARKAINSDVLESDAKTIFQRPVSSNDILFYAMNLDKIVQRVRAHNYVVFVEPTKITDELRACVLVDPNGIRIRLIESAHCAVDAAFEARIGYVSVPVREFASLSRSISFYQQVKFICFKQFLKALLRPSQVFGAPTDTGAPQGFRTGRQITGPTGHSRNGSGMEKSSQVFSKKSNLSFETEGGSQFTLRDTESFPEDMTTMIWLGNGPRATNSTLCLRHSKGD